MPGPPVHRSRTCKVVFAEDFAEHFAAKEAWQRRRRRRGEDGEPRGADDEERVPDPIPVALKFMHSAQS